MPSRIPSLAVSLIPSLLALWLLAACDASTPDPGDAPAEPCLTEGAPCAPSRCVGETALSFVCRPDDDGLRCRAEPEACPGACERGVCLPADEICANPGEPCAEPACVGDDAVTGVCDGDFRCRAVRIACDAGACREGACVVDTPECGAPGDVCGAPICVGDSVATSICDADLACVQQLTPCGEGRVCSGGECFDAPVSPDACAEPGTACGVPRCVGPANSISAPVCDADLACVDDVRPCPRDAICRAGRCVRALAAECAAAGDACDPAPRCEGNVAVAGECSGPGLCVTRRFDCGDGLCRDGRCVDDVECPAAGAICAAPFCEGDTIVTGLCDDALRCRPDVIPCGDGFTCDAGRCQPVSPFVCRRRGEACGSDRCEGDTLVEPRCDGTLTCVEQRRPCLGGVCVEGVCEVGDCERPGALCGPLACEGNAAVNRVCDNRLRCVETRRDCAPGLCDDGLCPPGFADECEGDEDCAPSTCDGNAVISGVCDAGRCAEVVTPCGPDGLCQRGICFDAPVAPDACAEPGQACGLPVCAEAGEIIEQALCDADLRCVETQRVCPEDTACAGGLCVARLSDCAAPFEPCRARTCEGEFAVSGFCDADLRCVERRLSCGADARCVAGACIPVEQAGRCAVPGAVCFPTLCEGNTRVTGICTADGQCLPERLPCGADQICDGGVCFQETPPGDCARPGAPCGAPSCRFGQIVTPTCDADLRCVDDVRDCPEDGVCDGGRCIADDRMCARALETCVPGRCEGNVAIDGFCDNALRCNVERRDCGEGECQLGFCTFAPACPPDTVCAEPRCDGDVRVSGRCSDDGVCEEVRAPCGDGRVCADGVCEAVSPAVCQRPGDPCGEPACEGIAVVRFTCDDALTCAARAEGCPEGTTCDTGACRDLEPGECVRRGAICAPAVCQGNAAVSFSCDDALQCRPSGQPCPLGTICDAGECREPRPGECGEAGAPCGETVCQGNTVVEFTCDDALECSPLGLPCPPGTLCDAGECRAPGPGECAEAGADCGEPVCDGNTVVRPVCDENLVCAPSLFSCPAGTRCEAGDCVEDGGGACACATPGATVGPAPPGCDFADADQCSGWQSVIIGSEDGGFSPEEEEEALNRVVPDGTVFCAFGCCIRITCP